MEVFLSKHNRKWVTDLFDIFSTWPAINWWLTDPYLRLRYILVKLGMKKVHTLKTNNTVEMPSHTVPSHRPRWLFTKKTVRGLKKTYVVGDKGPSSLCLLPQPNHVEFWECRMERKKEREKSNLLLFLKEKKRDTSKDLFPFPFCQMKALQRWLGSCLSPFESCGMLLHVALL